MHLRKFDYSNSVMRMKFPKRRKAASEQEARVWTEEFQPAKAGEFPYGAYQTFASQMRLGA